MHPQVVEFLNKISLFPDMVKPLGDYCQNMGVEQGVIDGLTFPAVLDQTVLFEYTELVGNSAL